MADHYEVLGVSKNATQEEIKKKYLLLAKQYHPDQNKDPGATENFQKINSAYQILSNPQKRQEYDMYGDGNFGGGQGGFGGGFPGGGFGGDDFAADIFANIFGFGGKSNGPQHGSDIHYSVVISLELAILGGTKTLTYDSQGSCADCKSKGFTGNETNCKDCQGNGKRFIRNGGIYISRTCDTCSGQGKKYANKCGKCYGKGTVSKKNTIEYTIPKGMKNGGKIILRGRGDAGINNGEAGDLIITFEVQANHKFVREGDKLIATVSVNIVYFIIGGDIQVTDISNNTHTVHIKPGTKPTSRLSVTSAFDIVFDVVITKVSDSDCIILKKILL